MDAAKSNLISIVVPVYNEEQKISRCIESLLDLDYPAGPYEIIVVDNNSTDGTAEVIRKYPVTYVLETTRGPAAARNAGIRTARGEFIAFTDSDCSVIPQWLNLLRKGFTSEAVGGVAGNILPLREESEIERYCTSLWNVEAMISGASSGRPFAMTANVMYRKSILDQINGFSEEFPLASYEDVELGWRIHDLGYQLAYKPEAIVYHDHRVDLKGLYYLGFKYGYGVEMIKKMHPGVLPANNTVLNTLRELAGSLAIKAKSPESEQEKLEIRCTYLSGLLNGKFRSRFNLKPR